MRGTCLDPDLNKCTAQKTFETLEETGTLTGYLMIFKCLLMNFSYDNDFMGFLF